MMKLSQQATIVALASVLPVLASTLKLHVLDAFILSIAGALAVYNVNCLTKGGCNVWATLVAISFFATTLFQIRQSEGYDFYQLFNSGRDLNAIKNGLLSQINDLTPLQTAIDKYNDTIGGWCGDLKDYISDWNNGIDEITKTINSINDYMGRSTTINADTIESTRKILNDLTNS